MKFREFPPTVRKAVLLLWASWGFHCLFVYALFSGQTEEFPTNILYQQMAIGAILGVFFYRVKKWARIMGMLFSGAAAVVYIPVALLFYGTRPMISLFSIFNIGLFSMAIYFMFLKETSLFFRAEDPVVAAQDHDPPERVQRGKG